MSKSPYFCLMTFTIWVSQIQAFNLEELRSSYTLLRASFDNELKDVGRSSYWEGLQELHPVWDLMFYVTLLKTGHATPQLKEEVVKRVFSWQRSDGTWPLVPRSEAHFDVTATIALGMERIGIGKNDSRLLSTWTYLISTKIRDIISNLFGRSALTLQAPKWEHLGLIVK